MIAIHTSTIHDGSMRYDDQTKSTSQHCARDSFLLRHSINPAETTLVYVAYEGSDYCRYTTASNAHKGIGITSPRSLKADALVTTESGHALFLPLADCVGAVIYDRKQNILMVSHLGRHNLEQLGGTKSIEYLVAKHHSRAEDISVWLSPAAGREQYPLYAFENRSLHDVAVEQLAAAGVLQEHIDVSAINSANDRDYFSHSQFLKGDRETDGRFAIVAALK